MRRKRDYTDYLRDILDAAQKAERFIAGVEFEAFQANDEPASRSLPYTLRQEPGCLLTSRIS